LKSLLRHIVWQRFYSVLTKLPVALRIPPEMAVKLIESNIINRCRLVDLTYTEYAEIIKDAANKNLVSGAIFDGLHVRAALKAEVNRIYTNNFGDFRRSGDLTFLSELFYPRLIRCFIQMCKIGTETHARRCNIATSKLLFQKLFYKNL